jgi:predicted DCC family thiol-disulfide oxidoreductase YuxK
VKSELKAVSPPPKPVVIFDGDCKFCGLWIRRWQAITGDKVDYRPFQDASVTAQFPELPRERFENAVHLIETDGSTYSGAEAALRALAYNPRRRWLLSWYERSPAFARASECAYRFIARHRRFFSVLTRIGWGQHTEPPSYFLVRWLFLRSLGLIYLAAFVSLWMQIPGLIGHEGIQPAQLLMESMRRGADAQNIGLDRYRLAPTLCWLNANDGFVKFQCAVGTALAIALTIGFAPAACLFLLWIIYLSLSTVCGLFLGFQWDILLLEVGFLSIFFAPLKILPGLRCETQPSRIVLWLLRWLLFRLMFQSGCVKLLSHDPTWHNLTALYYHYETQPLPTWIGWYAHRLPAWTQRASTAIMFGIELVAPFFIFAPRRLRHIACAALIALQVLIILTGNYCFFNLLTIALCLLLLDDVAVRKWTKWLPSMSRRKEDRRSPSPLPSPPGEGEISRAFGNDKTCDLEPAACNDVRWMRWLTIPLALIIVVISLIQFSAMFRWPEWTRPKPVLLLYEWLSPFRSINSYGLFAIMTTNRMEIVIEGSTDGKTWLPYEFEYKPGDVNRRPRFVAPHQPRLDWQMWFAALGTYRENPWLIHFCLRLLHGSPDVLKLLETNPFPTAPPRYIRAVAYDYHFTNFAERRKTGASWKREAKGLYLPAISLRETQPQ